MAATGAPDGTSWAAAVVNPAKAGDRLDEVEDALREASRAYGWGEPRIWHTTVEDGGGGQAREALEAGASLVVAAGGDGTVRAVAGVLAATDVPMGLVPMGTGNLLARNIGVPLDDLATQVDVAFGGRSAPVDLAWVTARMADGEVRREASLVIAGIGFDAEVVGQAPERLKKRLGWGAYVATGLPLLNGKRLGVRVTLDDRRPFSRQVRTILVASCGTLTGGVVLVPQAVYDDGLADVLTVAPKGIAGWFSIIRWALRGAGADHGLVRHDTATRVRIETERPAPAQFDGDAIGDVLALDVEVKGRAVLVRVPERTVSPELEALTAVAADMA